MNLFVTAMFNAMTAGDWKGRPADVTERSEWAKGMAADLLRRSKCGQPENERDHQWIGNLVSELQSHPLKNEP